MSKEKTPLRPIKGGRLTVHKHAPSSIRITIIPPWGAESLHLVIDSESHQPVILNKAVTLTIPADALRHIVEER